MGDAINSYRDLRLWQRAMDFAEAVYMLTRSYPQEEKFGLTSQMRRASSSIPANIAEGHGRESTQSFIQFLRISQGSLKELETHLLLSARVKIITEEEAAPLLRQSEEIGKMTRSLIRSLQTKN